MIPTQSTAEVTVDAMSTTTELGAKSLTTFGKIAQKLKDSGFNVWQIYALIKYIVSLIDSYGGQVEEKVDEIVNHIKEIFGK